MNNPIPIAWKRGESLIENRVEWRAEIGVFAVVPISHDFEQQAGADAVHVEIRAMALPILRRQVVEVLGRLDDELGDDLDPMEKAIELSTLLNENRELRRAYMDDARFRAAVDVATHQPEKTLLILLNALASSGRDLEEVRDRYATALSMTPISETRTTKEAGR